jgi:manganese transport protein
MASSPEPQVDVRSLPEVHGTVTTDFTKDRISWIRRILAFFGPAYLVSVGYMDPGNWATDLEGGARFGYQLLWVLVMSNLMAILLQTLSARLGIVAGRDLAQACREIYPRPVNLALWVICELAIAAMDMAELLGAAIALKLLFGLPLLTGVLITAVDTFLILWLARFGIRTLEAVILVLISTISGCMLLELLMAKPSVVDALAGLRPVLTSDSLLVAIGILGATVMPHNLYLHSALVQTRQFGQSEEEKRRACRFNFYDSAVALNLALFVNAAILVLAAEVFHRRGIEVTQIEQAYELLAPLLGTGMASVLFALALLAAGQSSTITGTMAGQVVMEGFLDIRMSPWLRRFITRCLAIVPAALVIYWKGEQSTYQLLIVSQVILSLQLPFAVVPLIQLTSDKSRMGNFANPVWTRVLAWAAVVVIAGLNIRLVVGTITQWSQDPSWLGQSWWGQAALWVPVAGLFALLLWISLRPLLPQSMRAEGRAYRLASETQADVIAPLQPVAYQRILVPLDHSEIDRYSLAQAAALAKQHGAKICLVHVEEGMTSQVYGSMARTAEVERGHEYLLAVQQELIRANIETAVQVRHGRRPATQIIKAVTEWRPDLVVMGAHGHTGWKDLLLGNTINRVRHEVKVPMLIVRRPEVGR